MDRNDHRQSYISISGKISNLAGNVKVPTKAALRVMLFVNRNGMSVWV
jgi:hypothetical protein